MVLGMQEICWVEAFPVGDWYSENLVGCDIIRYEQGIVLWSASGLLAVTITSTAAWSDVVPAHP